MMEEIMNKTEFPDSLEVDFGRTGNRGKVYFNAGNLEEAKERIKQFFKAAELKEELLEKAGVKKRE